MQHIFNWLCLEVSQHFNARSMLFHYCGSTLRSNVENETKSDVGFSTLDNVDTAVVYDVETTLHHVVSMLFQR